MRAPPTAASDSAVAGGEKFAAGALVAGAAVMGSRLLGLLREQVFAFFFGASAAYDAFLVAFRIPNLLRDLFAEGALSQAFVAVFSRRLAQDGRPRAFALASATLTALAAMMVGVVAVGIWGAAPLVHAMAPGFTGERAALTVLLTQIMAPFILWVSLAAVLMGMLNALGHFALPQSASSFFNLASMGVGLGAAWALAPEAMQALWRARPVPLAAAGRAMVGMAIGTLAGGVCQCLVQVPGVWRAGFRWRPARAWAQRRELVEVMVLMGPSVLGAAAVQANVLVNSHFASRLGEGPISWLSYAFRLLMFPIGVFGVAVTSAALPALARQGGRQPRPGFALTLAQGLEMVAFLCLPAAAGLMVLGAPLVALVFEHGRFGPADTRATAAALAAYAFGLPAYAGLKLIQPAFVALGDARSPMRVSLASVAVNLGLNALWVGVLHRGHVGLALSTSLLATTNFTVLAVLMRRRGPPLPWRRVAGQTARMAVAAGSAAALMAAGRAAVPATVPTTGRHLVLLALVAPLAAATYLGVAGALDVAALGPARALWAARGRRRRRR